MESFTDEIMRGLLASSLETATIDKRGWRDTGRGPGSSEARYIDWLTIHDNARSVVEDVARIRSHPLVNKSIPIYGYIYDVKSGRLIEVPEASAVGSAGSALRGKSTKAGKASSKGQTAKAVTAKGRKPAKAMAAAASRTRKPGKAIKAAKTGGRRSGKTKAA
jgi:hypothetical protein